MVVINENNKTDHFNKNNNIFFINFFITNQVMTKNVQTIRSGYARIISYVGDPKHIEQKTYTGKINLKK